MDPRHPAPNTPQAVLGQQPRPIWLWLTTIAMLLIMTGTILPVFRLGSQAFRYIYAAGALLLIICRIFTPYTGEILRLRRLYRIESWSALFFCVAAFFLFYNPTTARDWLAFTLAGGAIQIYTSIMIPIIVRRNLR